MLLETIFDGECAMNSRAISARQDIMLVEMVKALNCLRAERTLIPQDEIVVEHTGPGNWVEAMRAELMSFPGPSVLEGRLAFCAME
jgi:hypothetical protein